MRALLTLLAEVMGISSPTVQREWRSAKAWLHRTLTAESQPEPL